jgi:cyclopropane fatty-acyl-phospholipid synthase-like methyltransferase
MITQENTKNIGIQEGHPGFQPSDASHYEEWKHQSYKSLADKLLKTFPNAKSILELGSGAGSLSWWLRSLDPNRLVVSVDGSPSTMNSPYIDKRFHIVAATDEPFQLLQDGVPMKFDLVVSYEHFEHIRQSKFDILIDNISQHSHPDTILHATAATWGKNYPAHVNYKAAWLWRLQMRWWGLKKVKIWILRPEICPFNLNPSMTAELCYKFQA